MVTISLLLSILLSPAVFEVPGLTCPTCTAPVKKAVALIDGVKSVKVDWRTRRVEVGFDKAKVDDKTIRAALSAAGFPAKAEDTPPLAATGADYLVVDNWPDNPKGLAVWGKSTVIAVCTPGCAPCATVKTDLKLFAERAERVAIRVITVQSPEAAGANYLPPRADIPYLYVYGTKAEQLFEGGMGDGQAVYRAVEKALGITK